MISVPVRGKYTTHSKLINPNGSNKDKPPGAEGAGRSFVQDIADFSD